MQWGLGPGKPFPISIMYSIKAGCTPEDLCENPAARALLASAGKSRRRLADDTVSATMHCQCGARALAHRSLTTLAAFFTSIHACMHAFTQGARAGNQVEEGGRGGIIGLLLHIATAFLTLMSVALKLTVPKSKHLAFWVFIAVVGLWTWQEMITDPAHGIGSFDALSVPKMVRI